MSESFAELFEESLLKTEMKPGALVTGVIVSIDNDFVVVNAGLKSEGVIPLEQFATDGEINVGDEVEVSLDTVEDGYGETSGGFGGDSLRVYEDCASDGGDRGFAWSAGARVRFSGEDGEIGADDSGGRSFGV